MKTIFYAESTGGFYTNEAHAGHIPADAVEITEEVYEQMLNGQASGNKIDHDIQGLPVLVPPPPLTDNQIAENEIISKRASLKIDAKIDEIFTDIKNDTIAQLVGKIETHFPNPEFTNQQQKLLKACLIAASIAISH